MYSEKELNINNIESLNPTREAKKYENVFKDVLSRSAPFEIKGILNSEMLLFVSLAETLGVKHIIESGRARGQSTEVIARWLAESISSTRFDSIEFDSESEDVAIAESRIRASGYPVNLHYGDAFELLPEIINIDDDKKIILIDGPKGVDAVILGLEALANSKVVAVCIHDVHKDDNYLRGLLEKYWPTLFASDNKEYVDMFRYMDQNCWDEHQKHSQFKGWGPYKRGKKVMKSYGPTLICLFNCASEKQHQDAVNAFKIEKVKSDKKLRIKKLIGSLLPEKIKKNRIIRNIANRILS